MLFDPFEKQFDLPTALVELCDRQRRKHTVVGQEHEAFLRLGIQVVDATQWFGIRLRRLHACQNDRLIAAESGRFVDGMRLPSLVIEIVFGATEKERGVLMQPIQTGKVDVRFVHDVKRARLDRQFVEDVHIVCFSVRNPNKTGYIAPQVDQRVKFDGSLVATKGCPRKERKAQIDGRGIEGVGGALKVDTERFVGVEHSCSTDKYLREVGVDSPVAATICVGDCAARDPAAKAHVVKFCFDRSQTCFDVSQTFAVGQLREGHGQEVIVAGEASRPIVSPITSHALVEIVPRKEVHQLREHQLASMHRPSPAIRKGSKDGLLSLAS